MSIQQSFNQGLMGTTFLLGQVPAFKQAQENALQVAQVTNAAKSVNKTAGILKEHYGDNNVPKEAQSIVNSNVDTFLENASKSLNPKVAAGAIIAMDARKPQQAKLSKSTARMFRQAAIEVQKEQQAKQAAVNDLEKRTANQRSTRDAVVQVRPFLSNTQYKKLVHNVEKEERRQQNGADE